MAPLDCEARCGRDEAKGILRGGLKTEIMVGLSSSIVQTFQPIIDACKLQVASNIQHIQSHKHSHTDIQTAELPRLKSYMF